jgi:DNA polymerase III subunit gamma/tau
VALDTKYRPIRFDDVIGQDASVKVLRQFVRSGTGFHQSYVFCGFHGSGKTTMGRILARALLCEAPVDGDPCDLCASCTSILERGSSECFTEFDAATNSGKDDIRSIVETLNYDTFSGKRRIYLMDEAHRLSKDALDALLKPMEDTVHGSEDKLLVCIFCTTEPERMRSTIFSRCAPAFVIRRVTPDRIADRLAHVCDREGIPYERDALVLIAEATECHIRDGLKSLEGVSMLGGATVDNVRSYLRLNVNAQYLDILASIGTDLPRILNLAEQVLQSVSPATAYERLAEAAMLAYRVSMNAARPPSYWPREAIDEIGRRHGDHLVGFADTFASRPGNPVAATLSCDLSVLHHNRAGSWTAKPKTVTGPAPTVVANQAHEPIPRDPPPQTPIAPPSAHTPEIQQRQQIVGTVTAEARPPQIPPTVPSASAYVNDGGVYIDPRAVGRRPAEHGHNRAQGVVPPMGPDEFRSVLSRLVREISVDVGGTSS